jgi:hypothetical protein
LPSVTQFEYGPPIPNDSYIFSFSLFQGYVIKAIVHKEQQR